MHGAAKVRWAPFLPRPQHQHSGCQLRLRLRFGGHAGTLGAGLEAAVLQVVDFHPNYADLYQCKVSELGKLLRSEDTREEAMTAIRSLVDRIEVRAGTKRGETEVTLIGALAGILALGTNKNAAPEGGGTFLLVAGVGFEPTTFRL